MQARQLIWQQKCEQMQSVLKQNRIIHILNTGQICYNESRFSEMEYKKMKLRNVLIVVSDIEESINFYRDLFGLQVVLNNDGNVIMTEGLVLQDKNIWKDFLEKDVVPQNNMTELYFEEKNIEDFVEKLNNSRYEIQYVNELMEHSWGQKMVRFYDLDGNLIEVGTPIN